jgi:uncharacterized protein YbjT (DUF2867 family)
MEGLIMILVTGATGIVGRPLIDLLLGEGAEVCAVTRDAQAAGLPAEVRVVEGNPSRPDTIAGSLAGVATVFLHPRAVRAGAGELLALARERGARRVVALSSINVDDELDSQPSRHQGDLNKEADEAAAASGLQWVSLRVGSFADNAQRAWGAQIRGGDVVRFPYAAFTEAPLHERDLAAVVARALLTDDVVGRRGRRLQLTGPQALTHAEMVATIGEVIGRPLQYQEVPPAMATQAMIARGFPEPFVTALMGRYAREIAYAAPVTGEVERICGRPGLTFAEWVADHAAEFRN